MRLHTCWKVHFITLDSFGTHHLICLFKQQQGKSLPLKPDEWSWILTQLKVRVSASQTETVRETIGLI